MRKLYSIHLLLATLWLYSCQSSSVYPVQDFGAQGDGKTLNTQAIQAAIDACHDAGGGEVLIADGIYVSGTLLLKSHVTLKVAKGATLIGSPDPRDYQSIDAFTDATGQVRGKCLIGALEVENVKITGQGTIDGQGKAFHHGPVKTLLANQGLSEQQVKELLGNRPFLLRFVRSAGIELRDIHLRQPAAWTCHFFQSSEILVDGIDIYSHAHQNNDGIDLDSSHDAIIRKSNIDAGDDAICFKTTSPEPTYNMTVRDCRLKSDWGAIKFGTESMGDMHHIYISQCLIDNTKGGGIKILSVDGANIHHIRIDSIEMTATEMPIFVRLGERRHTYRDASQQSVGSIDSVTISNVNATTRSLDSSRVNPPSGIFLTGTQDHKIGHVTLENIKIQLPGGGAEEHAAFILEEMPEHYPEFSFFGVLPAYGMYARHIENLTLTGFEFVVEEGDQRPPIRTQEVDQHEFISQASK
ncbi:glycosyl hydrolase family 28 protein [Reichenbachiella agarivorans]|uniref:Glycosyl hydrolase family 28 protein n=1 Tax=Reichenbachiella agarivorans TaxID=2979464 RepID=A0ABY6CNG3_9BACT|nr:glycosyl hydrolase family 28 protein [Reichenbachiella agarivorans]UXP32046.1 glycosyl hydrolase family 28 protein [Reichenbachiella agarivorans]